MRSGIDLPADEGGAGRSPGRDAGRTLDVRRWRLGGQGGVRVAAVEARGGSPRRGFRSTPGMREKKDRAAAVGDTGLTEFVVSSAVNAAQRVLADRDRFELDAVAAEAWAAMNDRPARDLPGLRRLMERPSLFVR